MRLRWKISNGKEVIFHLDKLALSTDNNSSEQLLNILLMAIFFFVWLRPLIKDLEKGTVKLFSLGGNQTAVAPRFQSSLYNLLLGKQERNSYKRKPPQKIGLKAALVPISLGPLKHHLAKFKCTCCFLRKHRDTHFLSSPWWTMAQSAVGRVSLVKEPLRFFSCAQRRAVKTLSRSKSASLTSAAPYQLKCKGPQSRCFSREWLYGFGLCFQTPWLIISQPLEMFTLYWQLTQSRGRGALIVPQGP